MKIRLLLASMCVAGLAFNASAHRDRYLLRLEKDWCWDQEKFFAPVSDNSYMWYVSKQTLTGMTESSNIPGQPITITVDGVDYPGFECIASDYTTDHPFTLNIRHARTAHNGGPANGTTKGNVDIYTYGTAWNEYIQRPQANMEALVKIILISDDGAKDVTLTIRGKTSKKTRTVKWEFGSVPADGTIQERYLPLCTSWPSALGSQSDKWYMFQGATYDDINISIPNFKVGDKVAVVSAMLGTDVREKDNATYSNYTPSIVRLSNEPVRVIYSHDGGQIIERRPLGTGVTIVQAEDFDEPSADRPVTHSATAGGDGYGYPGRHKAFDTTCDNIRINVGGTGGGFCSWDQNGSRVNAAGAGQDFGLENFAQQNWDAPYTGTLQEDGTATLEDLANFYGAWTEYTVNVPEECYADISLRNGIHAINYSAYKSGAAPSPNVTGENVNYMQKYGGAYRIFVDGQPIRSAWSVRPPAAVNEINDLNKWQDNKDPELVNLRVDGENTNSYFVYATPNITHAFGTDNMGTVWNSVYKYELGDDLHAAGNLKPVDNVDNDAADRAKELMHTPDYANIYLSAGPHIIKVQAMGGQSSFDEMMIKAHSEANTPTGIEAIGADGFDVLDADAPVEYYNLQGVKVVNPQGGIFIRKQGTKVSKVVVR